MPQPRFLWPIILIYVAVLLMSNWYDARIIEVFGFSTDAGTLIFPITFLCANLITEVYGFKNARFAIWFAFLVNLIFLCYGWLITQFPSPDFAIENNIHFDTIMSLNIWIVLASFVSYFCGEPLNVYLVAKLKVWSKGRWMALRFVTSTFCASAVDSFLFAMIAFSFSYRFSDVISIAITMWLIKVTIEVIGLPLSVFLAKKLKHTEAIDTFDNDTNFTLFSLKTNYKDNNNHFNE